jgi:hypothetical protein
MTLSKVLFMIQARLAADAGSVVVNPQIFRMASPYWRLWRKANSSILCLGSSSLAAPGHRFYLLTSITLPIILLASRPPFFLKSGARVTQLRHVIMEA